MLIELSYLADIPLYTEEKPYTLFLPGLQDSSKVTNCEFVSHDSVPVENVRGREANFSLDNAGFAFIQHQSQQRCSSHDFENIENGDTIVKPYLKECIQIVKDYLNPDRVLCFDWRIRRSSSKQMTKKNETLVDSRFTALDTASVVHLDYSHEGGRSRLHRQLSPQEISDFSIDKYRIRIINLWRPLVDIVHDAPLALCDRRTVDREQLLSEDKVHEDYLEEGQFLIYRASQKWYWLSEQSRNEATIFVTWDSDETELCACAPHTAFQNLLAPANAPPRESVEVRLMIFEKR